MSKILLALLLIGTCTFGSIVEYNFRAYGVGGDTKSSQVVVNKNGDIYTVLAFSKKNISNEDTSILGDFTIILLHVENQTKQLKLSADYKNSDIVIKVYKSNVVFDNTTLVYETGSIYLDKNYINQTIQLP